MGRNQKGAARRVALLTRGAVAGALSLCGGLFSVGVMWLLRRFGKPTPFILSASGAKAT